MKHLSAPHKSYIPPPIDDHIFHEVEKNKGISLENHDTGKHVLGFEPPKYSYLPPQETNPSVEHQVPKIKVTHNDHIISQDTSSGKSISTH